jgi:anti-sigma regulatory factor (Ser/Thr protein kinase)
MSFLHEALYYSDQDQFLAGSLAFVREGLAAGEPVLVGVVEPRLSLLRRELGVDGEVVRFVNMAQEGRNPNRILPWLLRAFADRYPGPIRVLGEPIYVGRPPEEMAPCIQHEALVNLAFAERDASILCPYDVKQLAHIVPYAERTHPVVRGGSGRRASTSYTDPYTVMALFNQPLPERKRVDDTVVFDVQGLAGVRRTVGAFADAAGITADRVADLQLAVTEIGTNALIHAGNPVATLRLWAEVDRVVCEVRGAGEIADIMAGRVVPSHDSPRGRGLLIANRLCDLVQTYTAPTGTTTRLHMRVSPT